MRKRRFELTIAATGGSRILVGDDIGNETCTDLFLCLPGILETRDSFNELALWMGPAVRVMTVDWCGRGESQRLGHAHEYRMSVYLNDLSTIYAYAIGALSRHPRGTRPRIHLIGTSMGGLLAVFFATQKPQLLGTVVLNDIGPFLPWSGILSLMIGLSSAKTEDLNQLSDATAADLAERLSVDPLLLRAVRQPGHLDLPHETKLAGIDFSGAFGSITAALLLLRGKNSEIISDNVVKRLFEIQSLTQIYECEKSGHPVRYSEETCRAILDFTARH